MRKIPADEQGFIQELKCLHNGEVPPLKQIRGIWVDSSHKRSVMDAIGVFTSLRYLHDMSGNLLGVDFLCATDFGIFVMDTDKCVLKDATKNSSKAVAIPEEIAAEITEKFEELYQG